MKLKWTDTLNIAIEPDEAHPDVDPQYIRFTDLHDWVCNLESFDDDPNKSQQKSWNPSRCTGLKKRTELIVGRLANAFYNYL